jgi:hypothetical protein
VPVARPAISAAGISHRLAALSAACDMCTAIAV